ncbi:hypothetical protein PRIPAC_71384 [Pristionchus pacificus]|uniref:Uncharacterized protein n=1 Tax=Pristionchus pacificus TaxID=54126 RepID=A0A454Y0H4_PRIPA|nr:hypothetical protein PRIPAC_71384 [Pristionchus pacificus]|eukprot:PDM60913.1 hypothetical protein PRIPAC_54719 [Pristionchus pacificus]
MKEAEMEGAEDVASIIQEIISQHLTPCAVAEDLALLKRMESACKQAITNVLDRKARFTRAALEFDVVYSQTRKHWEREEEEMAFTDPLVHSIATGRLFQSVTRMEHCDESGDSDEFSRLALEFAHGLSGKARFTPSPTTHQTDDDDWEGTKMEFKDCHEFPRLFNDSLEFHDEETKLY